MNENDAVVLEILKWVFIMPTHADCYHASLLEHVLKRSFKDDSEAHTVQFRIIGVWSLVLVIVRHQQGQQASTTDPEYET